MKNSTILLSHEDILKLDIDLVQVSDAIKDILKDHSNKNTLLEKKITLRSVNDSFFTAMPSGAKSINSFCNKTICRPEKNLNNTPSVLGSLSLYDFETNKLKAVMDATWITSIRTGCVAALSALTYSRSSSNTISIMGMGNTAIATILFIEKLMPNIKIVKILSYKDHFKRTCDRFKHTGLIFEEINSVEELFKETDIIITCQTFSQDPFIKPEWLFDGMTAIPVHMRGWQECDQYFDKVFTDDYDHTKDWLPKFSGELGEVLSLKKPGRTSDNEKIICYNYGISIEDLAVASVVFNKAIEDEHIKTFIFDDYASRYFI